MITIAILKFLPPDENNISVGSIKMLSAVEINLDEDKSDEFYKDLILNGLLEYPNLLEREYCLRIVMLPKLMLYSNKNLVEIKTIIETVAAKYVSH